MCAKKASDRPFDFNEEEDGANYFVVDVSRSTVRFLEIARSSQSGADSVFGVTDCVIGELPHGVWKQVAEVVESVLRQELGLSIKNSTFKKGRNPMARMAGRELMVLVWALMTYLERAKADPGLAQALVPQNIASNWANLGASTRWLLYAMASAPVSEASQARGLSWRAALFSGLAANYT